MQDHLCWSRQKSTRSNENQNANQLNLHPHTNQLINAPNLKPAQVQVDDSALVQIFTQMQMQRL